MPTVNPSVITVDEIGVMVLRLRSYHFDPQRESTHAIEHTSRGLSDSAAATIVEIARDSQRFF
jgi:hypothetical protein